MKTKVLLSGFSYADIPCGYDDSDSVNGYVVVIDGVNYAIYEDPCDGYRSYGCFGETNLECKNTFPPQEVYIETYGNEIDTAEEYYKIDGVTITNIETGEVILDVSTQWYDSYYPMAYLEYHPENLPINKNR